MNRCTVLNKKLVFDFPLTDGDYFFIFIVMTVFSYFKQSR